jgi:hypothetical protein
MKKIRSLLLAAVAMEMAACATTNSSDLYDPNAPVVAISISTFGSVDPSDRSIALPPGNEDLLVALRTALTADGWTVSTSTTATRYLMQLETKNWTYEQRLSYINLTVVDEKTANKILTGERKTYSPNDNPIDLKAVADMVVSSLKKTTSPAAQSGS